MQRHGRIRARQSVVVLLSSVLPACVRSVRARPVLSTFISTATNLAASAAASSEPAPEDPPGSSSFTWKLVISAALVLLGGVFAGLTLGLLGLDMVNLEVLENSGEPQEQKDAAKVSKLLKRGRHWVLVCLLLSNVVVNETLPIFLDSILGGGVGAVVISTAAIVIFGEIVPQSVCARYGLRIGAWFAPFVLVLMYLEFPIAWPIAKLLDRLLGEDHGTVYRKAELKTFVGLHGKIGEELLNEDEVTIISAVLELSEKTVEQIMTPIEDLYSLPADTILDDARIHEIIHLGHSRIPITEPGHSENFIGMLIVKKLISYDPAQAKPISAFSLSVLPETSPDSTCLDALNYFQQGRSHMLLVSKTPGEEGSAMGIVSLEDVIEEMIGEEIVDETDIYVDVHTKTRVVRGPAKKIAAGKALAPLIKGVIERRKVSRRNTWDYGTQTPASDASTGANGNGGPPPGQSTRAFGKVKVRGSKLPDRRSGFVNRVNASTSSPVPGTTPEASERGDGDDEAETSERTSLMPK